jgi:hypothetical protein
MSRARERGKERRGVAWEGADELKQRRAQENSAKRGREKDGAMEGAREEKKG